MMTTNFNRILNDNLDMFDTAPVGSDEREYSNGMGWCETEDGIIWDEDYDVVDDDDDDGMIHFIDGTVMPEWEYLKNLRNEMRSIAKEHGRDSKEFIDAYSYYSDVYKDIHGIRPHSIAFLEGDEE